MARTILTIAVEDDSLSPIADLPDEEATVAEQEANADAATAAADTDTVDQTLQTITVLEDLAEALSTDTPLAPETANAANLVSDALAVGTDTTPEEANMPVLEAQHIGRVVSVEGFRDRAADMWRAIWAYLKKIWARITDFFYKIFGTIPSLRRKIADMQKRVDSVSVSKPKNDKITATSGLSLLLVGDKVIKNGGEYITAMGELAKMLTEGANGVSTLTKVGEIIAEQIGDFDPDNAVESAKKTLIAVGAEMKDEPSANLKPCSRYPGFRCYISNPLPGNKSIVTRSAGKDTDESKTVLGNLERLGRSGVFLERTSDKEVDIPSSADIVTLNHKDMSALLSESIKVLDAAEMYNRSKAADKLAKVKEKISTASQKAASKSTKVQNSDTGGLEAVRHYRAVLALNVAFSNWTQNPAIPLIQHSMSAVRASLALVAKSVSEYH